MRSLENDLERLVELDKHRVQSAVWRDNGRRELAKLDDEWQLRSAPMSEAALTIRALLAHSPQRYEQRIRSAVEWLHRQTPADVFCSDPDKMPILRAARVMHALVKSPASPFSLLVMCSYYRIVRELHSAHAPEWITGGARAGDVALTTAYVTGECLRAIGALTAVLTRLSATLRSIAALSHEWDALQSAKEIPAQWLEIESRRLAHQFFVTLEPHRGNDALRPNIPRRANGSVIFDESLIEACLRFRESVIGVAAKGTGEFEEALGDIDDFRDREFQDEKPVKRAELLARTMSAHEIARGAVQRAKNTAVKITTILGRDRLSTKDLEAIAAALDESVRNTRDVVQPAIAYLSRVIDRELAAAASDDHAHADAPELAFAAASYGAADPENWDDERLRRAAVVLAGRISERGTFPFGRPLRPSHFGYKAHVIGSEVIRAFSEILTHVESAEVDPRVVKRMMMYFRDRAVADYSGHWHPDDPEDERQVQAWSTAFAVIALDHLNRMLDKRLNERILKYFTWRRVTEPPGLEELFYPDYGLVAGKVVTTDSIGVVLQRMRAHVTGIPQAYDPRDPVYSLILHGPAGTGKTKLVEALARSAGVPLVEVTPSDIVIGGVDAVERRARAVFKALSLLTRVVIMFDEFDPVLQRRDPHALTPSSVFSFLTPGMLPKLKTLHDEAKKRSCAYVLITNLIGKLDTAAIREGRFDARMGIYPPDLLSRAGRLFSVIWKYEHPVLPEPGEEEGEETVAAEAKAAYEVGIARLPVRAPKDTDLRRERIAEVIQKTGNMSMNTLGKRGWYTAPSGDVRQEEDAFAYMSGIIDRFPDPPHVEDELRMNGRGPEALREFEEWAWVQKWDDVALRAPSLQAALDGRPDPPPKQTDVHALEFHVAASHCETCRQLASLMEAHNRTAAKDPAHAVPSPHADA